MLKGVDGVQKSCNLTGLEKDVTSLHAWFEHVTPLPPSSNMSLVGF